MIQKRVSIGKNGMFLSLSIIYIKKLVIYWIIYCGKLIYNWIRRHSRVVLDQQFQYKVQEGFCIKTKENVNLLKRLRISSFNEITD